MNHSEYLLEICNLLPLCTLKQNICRDARNLNLIVSSNCLNMILASKTRYGKFEGKKLYNVQCLPPKLSKTY